MDDLLTSGVLDSPGLVDYFGSTLITASSPTTGLTQVMYAFRDLLIWAIEQMKVLSFWIRSEPIVMAVIAMLFAGFIVAIFMRVYNSV